MTSEEITAAEARREGRAAWVLRARHFVAVVYKSRAVQSINAPASWQLQYSRYDRRGRWVGRTGEGLATGLFLEGVIRAVALAIKWRLALPASTDP